MRLRMLVLAALLFGAVLVVTEVTANAATTITPEKVTRIRNRCVENQAALNRLQTTDAFLRNDRGNLYRRQRLFDAHGRFGSRLQ